MSGLLRVLLAAIVVLLVGMTAATMSGMFMVYGLGFPLSVRCVQ